MDLVRSERQKYSQRKLDLKHRYQNEKKRLRKDMWKNHMKTAELPPGISKENWHRPAKKAKKSSSPSSVVMVRRHSISETQFSVVGGNTACTAISFVAACRMANKKNVDDVQSKIKWLDVLEKGASLWKTWRSEFSDDGPGRVYISLWDIRRLPQIKKWENLNRVLSDTVEMTGSLSNIVNSNMNVPENKSAYDLTEALDRMVSMGATVAVLTVEGTSLSLWHRSGCWAMYDSHGGGSTSDCSCLVLIEADSGGAVAMEKILRTRFKFTEGRRMNEVMYYMSIMRADKVASCKPKNRIVG